MESAQIWVYVYIAQYFVIDLSLPINEKKNKAKAEDRRALGEHA